MHMPQLRTPIVLVHGLFGFDQIRIGDWVLGEYFHALPSAMRAAGNRVILARLAMTAGVAQRAAELKAIIDRESPTEPVHLLAHSMGGLDSRYLISRLGMAHRVLTLATLGAPHRGSPFADWSHARLVRLFCPIFDAFNLPRQAFTDLTVGACKDFNLETPDHPDVRYFSVAGRFETHWLNPAWQFTAPVLTRAEGDNDGIVSVASATWGEHSDVWEGDHMNLVNWPQPWTAAPQSDRTGHYAGLLGRLRDLGF